MQTDSYLARIACSELRGASEQTLAALHLAHMRAVPFENLDIPLGEPIDLALPALYQKIVVRRRGGFCFELNGLFGWLLQQLGYGVSMLSARVCRGGQLGPEFEHALLLIDGPQPFIADVGFGDSFQLPLPLVRGNENAQHGTAYRLMGEGELWRLEQRQSDGGWKPQYQFSLVARQLQEFAAMARQLSTAPDSSFVRRAICSAPTPGGRVTLSGNRLILTAPGQRDEQRIATAHEYRRQLQTHFGMPLPEGAPVEKLLALTTAE